MPLEVYLKPKCTKDLENFIHFACASGMLRNEQFCDNRIFSTMGLNKVLVHLGFTLCIIGRWEWHNHKQRGKGFPHAGVGNVT